MGTRVTLGLNRVPVGKHTYKSHNYFIENVKMQNDSCDGQG